jgi:hypothetical protein
VEHELNQNASRTLEVEMAGFNKDLELGRIARGKEVSQSKKLMRGIKGIYSEPHKRQIAVFALLDIQDLLDLQRHNVGVSSVVLTVVHGDLLVAPLAGKLVGADEDHVGLVRDLQF